MRKLKLISLCLALAGLAAAFSAGSASATVLCKTEPVGHVCPAGQRYENGAQLQSHLVLDSKLVSKAGIARFECSGFEWNETVNNEGSKSTPVRLSPVGGGAGGAWQWYGCLTGQTVTTEGVPSAEINLNPGTNNGTVSIKFGEWLLTAGSLNCYFEGGSNNISTPVQLIGGTSPLLKATFGETKFKKDELRSNNLACSKEAQTEFQSVLSGREGKPIYVAEQ